MSGSQFEIHIFLTLFKSHLGTRVSCGIVEEIGGQNIITLEDSGPPSVFVDCVAQWIAGNRFLIGSTPGECRFAISFILDCAISDELSVIGAGEEEGDTHGGSSRWEIMPSFIFRARGTKN